MKKSKIDTGLQRLLADASVGISELKRAPAHVIKEAQLRPIVIFNRNRVVGYLISPQLWEATIDSLKSVSADDN